MSMTEMPALSRPRLHFNTMITVIPPKSSQKGISGIVGDVLKVRVNAPPVKGAANEHLRKILAEEFGIQKTAIRILRGHTSKEKIIEIIGIDSIPDSLWNKKETSVKGRNTYA